MKKITLLAVAAIAVLSMASCKKDRTCTCTQTSPGGSSSYTLVVTKVTKAGATQGACASGTTTETSGGTSYVITTSCTVK
ncbi:MAG TPA: hypothetical protein VNY73_05590 [Bacteroidia bacterium]|jgi:hypothetical protein|nr:hypothetical protein [Bacteroidia bacterium]